ncbi:hypothetical protein HK405_008711, partial [Cladochytrium tenue]
MALPPPFQTRGAAAASRCRLLPFRPLSSLTAAAATAFLAACAVTYVFLAASTTSYPARKPADRPLHPIPGPTNPDLQPAAAAALPRACDRYAFVGHID